MTTIINSVEIPNEHIALVKSRIISAIQRLITDARYSGFFFGTREINYNNEQVVMLMDKVAMCIIIQTLGPNSVFIMGDPLPPQELWDELYHYSYVEYDFVWNYVEHIKTKIDTIPGAFL